jgi:hypothetical protein
MCVIVESVGVAYFISLTFIVVNAGPRSLLRGLGKQIIITHTGIKEG